MAALSWQSGLKFDCWRVGCSNHGSNCPHVQESWGQDPGSSHPLVFKWLWYEAKTLNRISTIFLKNKKPKILFLLSGGLSLCLRKSATLSSKITALSKYSCLNDKQDLKWSHFLERKSIKWSNLLLTHHRRRRPRWQNVGDVCHIGWLWWCGSPSPGRWRRTFQRRCQEAPGQSAAPTLEEL